MALICKLRKLVISLLCPNVQQEGKIEGKKEKKWRSHKDTKDKLQNEESLKRSLS